MGATPPDEIAKQHAEACALLQSSHSMKVAARVDRGEIPLRWKNIPTPKTKSTTTSAATTTTTTTTTTNANPNSPHDAGAKMKQDELSEDMCNNLTVHPDYCISSRGQVDVTPLVKLITEGVHDPVVENVNGDASKKKNGNKENGKSKTNNIPSAQRKTMIPPLTNLWNEENAAVNNVSITRPSHDAWGIKKIVLIFCDDFLHTIYTLPWYQPHLVDNNNNNSNNENTAIGKNMHAAIQPILDTLHIQQSQVVRCILAGLPPGTTIPVHHDTGEWVKHTHRIHVPIIVNDTNKVLFRCGPTVSSMERVDCTPGHVFEMNNRAKHAATNACDTYYRVHLILDYVHPSFFTNRQSQNCPVQRVNLSPGEIITQTRRSIDRAMNAGQRNHPSFLILGAQKCGTTSLYEYMTQHPWIVRAKRRETHCLDWRWDTTLQSTQERQHTCLEYYHADSMNPYPSLRTGDSTPSYLLDYYRVIPRLKEVFPHNPQLIIMVREPIARAVSHYAMVTSPNGTPAQLAARGNEWRNKSLEEVLEMDIRNMKEDGVLPYWDMDSKTINMEVFNHFINTREEDTAWERYVTTRIPLNTGSYSILARGMYALQCRQWFRSFDRTKFLVMKLEELESTSSNSASSTLTDDTGDDDDGGNNNSIITTGVQAAVNKVMVHLGLPQFEVHDTEKKNSREYTDPLESNVEIRTWLQRFFAPHNARFGNMMKEELGYDEREWMDLWSYGE